MDAVIIPYGDAIAQHPAAGAEVERIFFDSSLTRSFADAQKRREFRQRWLGRYLEQPGDPVYVALDGGGQVLGYVAGTLRGTDLTRFADIGYFQLFAALIPAFPAHLHINLAAAARSQGLGAQLVARFVQEVRAAVLPGVHVVTGATSRNVRFYERNGFHERGRASWSGHDIVFLGHDCRPAEA